MQRLGFGALEVRQYMDLGAWSTSASFCVQSTSSMLALVLLYHKGSSTPTLPSPSVRAVPQSLSLTWTMVSIWRTRVLRMAG